MYVYIQILILLGGCHSLGPDTPKLKNNNNNNLKYGHSTRAYFAQLICSICAEIHKTFEHKCNICNTQGQACPHTTLKCSNCGENHMASSNICLFKTHPEKRSYKHAQNMQKIQQ